MWLWLPKRLSSCNTDKFQFDEVNRRWMLVWSWCKFGATLYATILSFRLKAVINCFYTGLATLKSPLNLAFTSWENIKPRASKQSITVCFDQKGGSICKNSAVHRIKRSESASLLVSERVQIAPRAFRQRRNIARSAAVQTVGEQRVCHTPSAITYSPAVRLHANPSDWIEKRPFENGLFSWSYRIKLQLIKITFSKYTSAHCFSVTNISSLIKPVQN